MLYASPDYALSIAGIAEQTATPATLDPIKLTNNLRAVTSRIDSLLPGVNNRQYFAPYIDTVRTQIISTRVNSLENTFRIRGSLLALTSVAIVGADLSAPMDITANVALYPDPTNPPFSMLQLTDYSLYWWSYLSPVAIPRFVAVTGVYGFQRDYANAFLAVDTLNGAISDTTSKTFTTTAPGGADPYGNTPAIAVGNLIQIDSEWMEVIAVNLQTKVVTVRKRGDNGTTATTHSNGASIAVWQVEEPVKRACALQADLMYARFGAYTTVDSNMAGGQIRYPADWLTEVRSVLTPYANS